jgi:hypothetical protein
MSIDRLLGTWEFQMHHVVTPDPVAGRQRYERVLDGAFVMMHSTYEHPDFPDAIALLTADAFHYFDVRGVTRIFESDLSDTGWSVIRRDSDFWQRSTVRFLDPNSMEGAGEISSDQGQTWEQDYTITYTRS